jgi:hypothetical protein
MCVRASPTQVRGSVQGCAGRQIGSGSLTSTGCFGCCHPSLVPHCPLWSLSLPLARSLARARASARACSLSLTLASRFPLSLSRLRLLSFALFRFALFRLALFRLSLASALALEGALSLVARSRARALSPSLVRLLTRSTTLLDHLLSQARARAARALCFSLSHSGLARPIFFLHVIYNAQFFLHNIYNAQI